MIPDAGGGVAKRFDSTGTSPSALKGNKMIRVGKVASVQQANKKKSAAIAPPKTKSQPTASVKKALGKGKASLGGKKDTLSNDFST